MKRIALLLLLLAAMAVGAFLFLQSKSRATPEAIAGFLPQDTFLLVHLPDLNASAKKFKETDLYKLWREPEIQAFLERPRNVGGVTPQARNTFARLKKLGPVNAFAAVTNVSQPKLIAGFGFTGSKADAEALLADLRKSVESKYPAGKSDLLVEDGSTIETFTAGTVSFGATIKGNRCLLSSDVDLLKRTLAALGGDKKDGQQFLASRAEFQRVIDQMPEKSELLLFAQLRPLLDRILPLLSAAGQPIGASQVKQLRSLRAFGAATNFDGGRIRDASFLLLSKEVAPGATLDRKTLSFTSADTVAYYASVAQFSREFQLPSTILAIPVIAAFLDAMKTQGVSLADLARAFGGESAFQLDWPAGAMQPALLVSLSVRDRDLAGRFINAAINPAVAGQQWAREEKDDSALYTLSLASQFGIRLAIGITNNFAVAGLDPATVKEAMKRDLRSGGTLQKNADFAAASSAVFAPNYSFGYIDTRTLFDRFYRTVRPLLVMSATLIPSAARYVDFSKLPSTEAVTKHLSPIVISQSYRDEGFRTESVGTVTFAQAFGGLAIGAAAVAMPVMERELRGLAQPVPANTLAEPAATPGTPSPTPEPLETE